MSLYPLFQWLEGLPPGVLIRQSTWIFTAIETVHLCSLALLGGSAFLLDLRLLGFVLPEKSTAQMQKQTSLWSLAGLLLLIASGALMLSSEAMKLYGNEAFWVKMYTLALAIPFTYLVRNPLARREKLGVAAARALGLTSLSLWLLVAAAGRYIGSI